jgi:hypothetical protein
VATTVVKDQDGFIGRLKSQALYVNDSFRSDDEYCTKVSGLQSSILTELSLEITKVHGSDNKMAHNDTTVANSRHIGNSTRQL